MGARRKLDWSAAMRDLRRDRTLTHTADEAEIARLRQLPNPIPTAEIAKVNTFVVARLMRSGWLVPNPQEGGFEFHDRSQAAH